MAYRCHAFRSGSPLPRPGVKRSDYMLPATNSVMRSEIALVAPPGRGRSPSCTPAGRPSEQTESACSSLPPPPLVEERRSLVCGGRYYTSDGRRRSPKRCRRPGLRSVSVPSLPRCRLIDPSVNQRFVATRNRVPIKQPLPATLAPAGRKTPPRDPARGQHRRRGAGKGQPLP